jgi:beta-glucosidase
LTPEKLSFYNEEMTKVVEPGEFEIMVGSSSVDYLSVVYTVK